jgi:hypothetical protein
MVNEEAAMAIFAMPPRDPDREQLEKVVVILTIILLTMQIELAWIQLLRVLNLLPL